MDCYKIIQDEQKLVDFIDWLPELSDNETYFFSLFARKKYCQNLIKSNDKSQLKSFTSSKERMLDKIKQLEIGLGRYKLKDTTAPQESLVLYIMPNPRCMKKATEMMGKKCWDLYKNTNYNIIAQSKSCIQKSKSRSCFVDFDIDTKEEIDFSFMGKIIPESTKFGTGYKVLKTRGGYHLLVEPQVANNNIRSFYNTGLSSVDKLTINWFAQIQNHLKGSIDNKGDQLLPIPGCCQGGFMPYFLN